MKNIIVLNVGKLHNPDIKLKFKRFNPNSLSFSVYSCSCWSTSSGINRIVLGSLVASFSSRFLAEEFVKLRLSSYDEFPACLEIISFDFFGSISTAYILYSSAYYLNEHDTDCTLKQLIIVKNF